MMIFGNIRKKKLKSVAGIIDNMTRMGINRHGAEAARWAHNPEDTGSKPVVGI
jgi:hypothetical protein